MNSWRHLFSHPPNLILVTITIISLLFSTSILMTQSRLRSEINSQNQKISELIKLSQDLKFSQDLSSDSSVNSLEQLKKMLQELVISKYHQNEADYPFFISQISSPSALIAGTLTLKTGVTSLTIYSAPKTNSPIIGSTLPPPPLTYAQKEAGWYLINLGSQQTGWIQSKYVTE